MHLSIRLLLLICSCASVASSKRLMTWLCLEFCEDTPEMIAAEMTQLLLHKDAVTAVSFEKYTLGADSTLVDNNLTEVSAELIQLGFEAWPLLSSFPHPPEFIDWMRQVFANPQPFIDQCIDEADKNGYYGYNLDWEPTDDVTDQDGVEYAAFIETFAQALHAADLKLSVDVATWNAIWDYDAIAKTSADIVISMGTYTSTDSSFTSQLDMLMESFGSRAGVGLEMVNASTAGRLPLDEVAWRFEQIEAAGAQEIDIWRSPIPPLWWPIIEQWMLKE